MHAVAPAIDRLQWSPGKKPPDQSVRSGGVVVHPWLGKEIALEALDAGLAQPAEMTGRSLLV